MLLPSFDDYIPGDVMLPRRDVATATSAELVPRIKACFVALRRGIGACRETVQAVLEGYSDEHWSYLWTVGQP